MILVSCPYDGRKVRQIITMLLKSWAATEIKRLNYAQSYTINDKSIKKQEEKLLLILGQIVQSSKYTSKTSSRCSYFTKYNDIKLYETTTFATYSTVQGSTFLETKRRLFCILVKPKSPKKSFSIFFSLICLEARYGSQSRTYRIYRGPNESEALYLEDNLIKQHTPELIISSKQTTAIPISK